jgi:hypothetical protein
MWVAMLELPRDPATGRRVRRKASAQTKTAALALLDAMRAEKRKVGTVGRRDLTVAALMADYLAHPPADWRSPVTVQVTRDHAARITKALGKVKLASLTPSRIERFLAELAADGYSAKTMADTRRLLSAAIRRAERDGQVARNVADLADAPAGKRREARWFTMPQVRALLAAAAQDPWWSAYIAVAVSAGCGRVSCSGCGGQTSS